MKRSRFVLACIAALAFVGSALAAPFVAVHRFVVGHVATACAIAAPKQEFKQTKPSWVVKAGAFAASMAKRERPVLTSSWRMRPSA